MATVNPFDLLGDDDNDDPSQLIAAQKAAAAAAAAAKKSQAATTQAPAKPAGRLPTKPLPPAQAVKEAKSEARGGGQGGERGYSRGRGGGGYNRGPANEDASGYSGFRRGQGATTEFNAEKSSERQGTYSGSRGSFHGGRRGGYNNEVGDEGRSHRVFERRSGSGQGNEPKREGSGRGNWGTTTDEIAQITEETANEAVKELGAEKTTAGDVADVNKENPGNEAEEKEPEDKEMTLEEYEKILEEKRKALQDLKTEERKVDVDKELASMQPLSNKKKNDDIFVKLGSDKDKKKEAAEKEEKSKKVVSINEFLKPAEGERYSNPRGRGRGRGSGSRGGYSGGGGFVPSNVAPAPKIEDPSQFPSLGGK